MKPKKNPNADLKKRTGLFFSIGLALATFASLYALNYRSVDKEKGKIEFDKVVDLTEDVKDFTMEENTPPPAAPPEPPKVEVDPQVIKRVDDSLIQNSNF